MKKSSWIICLTFLIITMLVGCNFPTVQTGNDLDSTPTINTASSQTSILLTPSIGIPTISTQETALVDKTIVAAVTITPAQMTPSSQTATITSTEDTNCRKGPGVMYDIVGKLLVGQTSDVVAKYQNGKFWLIKNPANPTEVCWVWDQTTKVTGNIVSLPEATPPATPAVTLNLTIYAVISPITYSGGCPVTVDLVGNYTVNSPAIVAYQWYIGDLLVDSGSVTAGSSGTFTSSDQITITTTTTDPIRLKASAAIKTVTTAPIGFSIICN